MLVLQNAITYSSSKKQFQLYRQYIRADFCQLLSTGKGQENSLFYWCGSLNRQRYAIRSNAQCRNQASMYKLKNGSIMKSLES